MDLSMEMILCVSGNFPTFFFENTSFPSTLISKTPPEPAMYSTSTCKLSCKSCPRPEALG